MAARPGPAAVGPALLLLLLLLALRADAHPETSPESNNRYLKLSLVGGGVRLAYTVFYGDLPSRIERPAMDRDHDGTISVDEGEAFLARAAGAVEAGLVLELDGTRVPVRFDRRLLGLGGRGAAGGPFSMDLYLTLPLAWPPRHRLRVDDRSELTHLGETEVRVEEGPSARLTASYRGATGKGLHGTTFRFTGPRASAMEDRVVSLEIEDASLTRPVPWAWLLGGAAALLLPAGFGARRLLRRRLLRRPAGG